MSKLGKRDNEQIKGKRSPQQIKADGIFIADLYTRGYTFREIAYNLNLDLVKRNMPYQLSFQMVYVQIKQIMIDWKIQTTKLIDEWITFELAKLDKIERELWDAWESSKTGKQRLWTKSDRRRVKPNDISDNTQLSDVDRIYGELLDSKMIENSSGNPKYLDLLLDVMKKRSEILGYNAPIKLQIQKPAEEDRGITINWNEVPDELLLGMADVLQNAAKVRKEEKEEA